jgi:Protein of unknown function (DUF3108)
LRHFAMNITSYATCLKSNKLVLLALSSIALGAQAAQPLTPYTAEYKVKISVLSGKLSTEFRRTDSGYSAKSIIKPTGLLNIFLNGFIEESSWFSVSDAGVVSERYQSIDTITSDQKEMNFRFDWDRREVSGTIGDVHYDIPLDGPVQDRVAIQYELMYELLNGAPADKYVMLNEEELRPIFVSNIGTKAVKVPFGKFEAVGIQHRNEDSSRVSTLWCVKELGYLPVIIEQHRDGKLRVRAVLTDYAPFIDSTTASTE